VLKKFEDRRDFAFFVRLGMTSQDLEIPAYARIGIIKSLEDDAQSWFNDVAMQSILLF